MGCNCGKSATVSAYVVKVPGKAPQTVASETTAQALTRGIRGASYRPVKG
jgi:hypothetical protein